MQRPRRVTGPAASSGFSNMKSVLTRTLLASVPLVLAAVPARAITFTAGDLVVSLSGNVDGSGPYADNQASPISRQQMTTTGVLAGSQVLPQTATTANGMTQSAISGEYGSSS